MNQNLVGKKIENETKYEKQLRWNRKTKHRPMSYVGHFEFFTIINIRDGSFSLRHDTVIMYVVGQQTVF